MLSARSRRNERSSRDSTACTRSEADSEIDVARAEAHAGRDVAFGDLRPHEEHRHLRRELVAHRRGLPRVRFGHIGADQQFGIELFERLAEVAHRRDPGAMHGLAGLAHQAVDELGRLALRRKNDERNGGIVRQVELPGERARA